MAKNPTAFNAPTKEKSKKMTKAEFLVALDEVNATLERDIAQVHESQARNQVLREETRKSIAKTREIIEAL